MTLLSKPFHMGKYSKKCDIGESNGVSKKRLRFTPSQFGDVGKIIFHFAHECKSIKDYFLLCYINHCFGRKVPFFCHKT